MQTHTNTKPTIHLLHDLDQLQFAHQRLCSNHVHVALIELAITTFLWTVSAPNGLNLITTEREHHLFAVLHNVTRKRYGQVITQTLLRRFVCFLSGVLNAE